MTTRLQTALARREQLKRTQIHLWELAEKRELTLATLAKIELALAQKPSGIKRLLTAIGANLWPHAPSRLEQQRELKHALLLKQRALENEVKLLDYECAILEEQLTGEPEVARMIAHLKQEKEVELLFHNGPAGSQLRSIQRRQQELEAFRQSLQNVSILGTRLAGQLLALANGINQFHLAGGLNHEAVAQGMISYEYLEKLRLQAETIAPLFSKYDAAIFELYRVFKLHLPAAPERFYKYGPAYFRSYLYHAEMNNDFAAAYLRFVELWKRVVASVDTFRSSIRQLELQLSYFEEKKDGILEEA